MRPVTFVNRLLIATSLCLGSTAIHAQALAEQYQLALANDNSLAASLKRHESTLQLDAIAAAAFRPTLAGSFNNTYDLETNSNADMYSASLGLKILVPAYHAKDGSAASIKQSAAELSAKQASIIADTINHYFAVVKQQIQIDSTKAQIQSAQQSLANIRKQRDLGLATELQTANVENNLQQLQLSLLQNQQALQQARNTLSLSTGSVIGEQLPGITKQALPSLSNTELSHWWALAEQHNANLQAQRFAVDKAYHDYKQTDAGKYPAGQISINHDSRATMNDNITLSVSGNFYDGGLNKAQTQQKRLAWQASQASLANLTDSTRQQLDNQLFLLRNNGELIELQKNLLASAESSLAAVEKEYQLGLKDLVALLEGQQALASAQVNLASSRYDRIKLQTNIQLTAGTLSQADLQALDQLLD